MVAHPSAAFETRELEKVQKRAKRIAQSISTGCLCNTNAAVNCLVGVAVGLIAAAVAQ
jgi:hypothetical protein